MTEDSMSLMAARKMTDDLVSSLPLQRCHAWSEDENLPRQQAEFDESLPHVTCKTNPPRSRVDSVTQVHWDEKIMDSADIEKIIRQKL